MDFNAIFKRAIALVTDTKNEWLKIKGENYTVNDLLMKYVIFLVAIPAIAGLIGFSIIGFSAGPFTVRLPFIKGLLWAIFYYVFGIAGLFVTSFIMDALAPSFGVVKNMNDNFKIVVFTSFPVWIASVLYIIPRLSMILGLVVLFSLYIFFLGLKAIKTPPPDKEMGYLIVIIIVNAVVFYVMGMFTSLIAFGSATFLFY